MTEILSWVMQIVSIAGVALMANHYVKVGRLVGISSQFLFGTYGIMTDQLSFTVFAVIYFTMYMVSIVRDKN